MAPPTVEHMAKLGTSSARIRTYRAAVKNELRRGLRGLTVDLLEDPDLAGMTIGELLRAFPYWGHVRTRRTLRRLRIVETRRLRELTDRQRRVIAATVPR